MKRYNSLATLFLLDLKLDPADSSSAEAWERPYIRISALLPEACADGRALLLHNCPLIGYCLRGTDISNELLHYCLLDPDLHEGSEDLTRAHGGLEDPRGSEDDDRNSNRSRKCCASSLESWLSGALYSLSVVNVLNVADSGLIPVWGSAQTKLT